jgi:hypothetical protein
VRTKDDLHNFWKERCRKVFDMKALPPSELQASIKADVRSWQLVWRPLVDQAS